jgi:hypothetical protein
MNWKEIFQYTVCAGSVSGDATRKHERCSPTIVLLVTGETTDVKEEICAT